MIYMTDKKINIMIVMIVDQQILSPKQVCQNCLMSNQSGLPRWHDSKLGCGKKRSHSGGGASSQPTTSKQAQVYECQMGFNLTWVN
ncbi:MAG: hypothetical protein RLZZ574_3277 [Cyanobacteriota bacterium]|jgi:hypothetical protein